MIKDGFAGLSSVNAVDVMLESVAEASVVESEGVDCPPFDETKRKLGDLCNKTGHEHGKTGKTLRTKQKNACILCIKEGSQKSRVDKTEVEPGKYLGKPCKEGCRYKDTCKTLRRVSDRACDFCHTNKILPKRRERYTKPKGTKLGKLCPKGHDYEGTGRSLRRSDNSDCIECCKKANKDLTEEQRLKRNKEVADRFKKKYNSDPEFKAKAKQKMKESAATPKGREGHKRRNKKYRERHRDRENQRVREYERRFPEKKIARTLRWIAENPERKRMQARRRRARKLAAQGNPYTYLDLRSRFEEFGRKCAYCQTPLDLLAYKSVHWDHVIPLFRGGKDEIVNLVPACYSCNSQKQAIDMEVWFRRQNFFCEARLSFILSITTVSQAEAVQLDLFSA